MLLQKFQSQTLYKFFVLVLSISFFTSTQACLAALETPPTIELVSSIAAVRQRMEKDHRVRLTEDKYKGKTRVHVYLVTANQTLPYLISLGWLRTTDTINATPKETKKKKKFIPSIKIKMPHRGKKEQEEIPESEINKRHKNLLEATKNKNPGLNAVDENNFVIPSLTESPLKSSRKVDLVSLTGFDALQEKKMDKAEKYFRQAMEEDQEDEKFLNNYGVILALKGEYKSARSYFDRALAINDGYAFALINRALLDLASGKPNQSLIDSQKSLSLLPDFHPALIARTRALLETGKKEEALKQAEDLKQKYSADWQTMLLLADSQLGNNHYKEAKETLSRLTVLSPNNWDLLLKLAHCDDKLGDLDGAIDRARKATVVGGHDPRTHIALARYLNDNQDQNASLLQFERALDLKPGNELRKTIMASILGIYVNRNKLDEAMDATTKWAKTYPEDAYCHFNRAWIASKMDDTEYRDIAIEEYREALRLDKKLNSARYNLALILINANMQKEAQKELNTFVKSSPDDKDVAHAKELLKKLGKSN